MVKKKITSKKLDTNLTYESSYNSSYEEFVTKNIDSSYYTIEEIEFTDELYLIEKELYLKKLEHYNKHKNSFEDLSCPKEFEIKYEKRIVPTDKAIRFYNEYNNIN